MSNARAQASDTEYHDYVLEKVKPGKGGWEINFDGSMGFYCPDKGVEPHVGDRIRLYGTGFGSVVRGLEINGQTVFYRTEAQQRARFKRDRIRADARRRRQYAAKASEYEAQIAMLPPEFQRRFARFQRSNPDFNWRFLGYELTACIDAVKIAAYCKTPEQVHPFHELGWEKQKQRIPDLFDGHSGNSFGAACRFAMLYLTDRRLIVQEHGAISMLVGCEEFGCLPGQGLEGEDLAFYEQRLAAASEASERQGNEPIEASPGGLDLLATD